MLKINVNAKDLQGLLKNAGESIGRNNTLPILSSVLIEAAKGQLKVSSTNLEVGISTTIDCEVIEEGTIAVEYTLLNNIVKELDNNIELSEKENEILIKSGNSKFKITKLNAEEYPSLPKIEGQSFAIPVDIFEKMINRTVFAVSTDTTRPILTGILIKLSNNTIEAVALDGYRLAHTLNVNEEIFIDEEQSLIIPGETMKKVAKLIEGETAIISTDGKFALFEFGNTILSTRLLDGNFINYKDILKQQEKSIVRVKTEEFYKSVKKAALIGKLLKLTVTDGEMHITSNEELASADEKVSITLEGDSITIAFNPKFLLEGVKAIDTEEIELYLSGENSPCILKGCNDLSYKYLVLPVRIAK